MARYYKEMRKDEIKALCAQNEAIARAYGERNKTPYANKKIVEMYEMAHFSAPVEEVAITFISGYRYDRMIFETRKGEVKRHLLENVPL